LFVADHPRLMILKSMMLRSRIGWGASRIRSTVWSSIFEISLMPVT
jgi:hypothetical protein